MNTNNDVERFMRAADQAVYSRPEFSITRRAQAELYLNLCREELGELVEAFEQGDLVEVADACADLKWVIEGLEHSLGIPQQAVWDEVARSNMSKTVDGKLMKREDGKVMKPDTYSPPDIKTVLNGHQ
jgi:NTP pyrophosphatase (non-canonical NTP hydrolase)